MDAIIKANHKEIITRFDKLETSSYTDKQEHNAILSGLVQRIAALEELMDKKPAAPRASKTKTKTASADGDAEDVSEGGTEEAAPAKPKRASAKKAAAKEALSAADSPSEKKPLNKNEYFVELCLKDDAFYTKFLNIDPSFAQKVDEGLPKKVDVKKLPKQRATALYTAIRKAADDKKTGNAAPMKEYTALHDAYREKVKSGEIDPELDVEPSSP